MLICVYVCAECILDIDLMRFVFTLMDYIIVNKLRMVDLVFMHMEKIWFVGENLLCVTNKFSDCD
jgi:hypothetical protein